MKYKMSEVVIRSAGTFEGIEAEVQLMLSSVFKVEIVPVNAKLHRVYLDGQRQNDLSVRSRKTGFDFIQKQITGRM